MQWTHLNLIGLETLIISLHIIHELIQLSLLIDMPGLCPLHVQALLNYQKSISSLKLTLNESNQLYGYFINFSTVVSHRGKVKLFNSL